MKKYQHYILTWLFFSTNGPFIEKKQQKKTTKFQYDASWEISEIFIQF